MAELVWHRPQLSKLGFRQANLDSISMALALASSPRYRERRLPSLISGTFGLTTTEYWLRSNLDSIRLRLKGVDSRFSRVSNVFNDLRRELDRTPTNLDNCGLCHTNLACNRIRPSSAESMWHRQTLLSVLVRLGTIGNINADRGAYFDFFFGDVAAMDSATFARKSFAADSSSGSVIVGRSASIIVSASLNLPSLALLTAS